MLKNKQLKSYSGIELEEAKVKLKNSKLKNVDTLGNRIVDNFVLFLLMIIGIGISYLLIYKFYHWIMFGPFPFLGLFEDANGWDIIGDDKMYWTSFIYGLIGIVVIIYLFIDKFIKDNKNKSNKWYYKIIVFTALGIHLLFYITNPWYTLQTHPRVFMYQNGKNITNKEIYFFLTERYGFKGTLYKPFKTLEDSIAGLEFAMRINEPSLYKRIFEKSEKFGYDNLIKNYNDSSFQLYFLNYILFTSTFNNNIGKINNLERNLNYIELILLVTKNEEIINLSNELLNKLNYTSKLNKSDMKIEMDNYLKEYLDKIFNAKTDKSNFL